MANNDKTREQEIIRLAFALYKTSECVQEEYTLDAFTNNVLNIFLETDFSIKEIENRLIERIARREKRKKDDLDHSKVSENHKKLYDLLKNLINLLNQEGVDYQLSGELSAFVEYNTEPAFAVNNINILVNEEDIPKVSSISEKLGLTFTDNRASSKTAEDSESNIIIRFYPFERKTDGTVVEKYYYHDSDNINMVRETIYPPELAELVYDKKVVSLDGVPIYVQPGEYTFLNIKSHNWKSTWTRDFLLDKVDSNQISKFESLMNKIEITNHPANDLENYAKDAAKQFVKQAKSEEGFISNTIITTLALITFVLCFIGITIIYLVK